MVAELARPLPGSNLCGILVLILPGSSWGSVPRVLLVFRMRAALTAAPPLRASAPSAAAAAAGPTACRAACRCASPATACCAARVAAAAKHSRVTSAGHRGVVCAQRTPHRGISSATTASNARCATAACAPAPCGCSSALCAGRRASGAPKARCRACSAISTSVRRAIWYGGWCRCCAVLTFPDVLLLDRVALAGCQIDCNWRRRQIRRRQVGQQRARFDAAFGDLRRALGRPLPGVRGVHAVHRVRAAALPLVLRRQG